MIIMTIKGIAEDIDNEWYSLFFGVLVFIALLPILVCIDMIILGFIILIWQHFIGMFI